MQKHADETLRNVLKIESEQETIYSIYLLIYCLSLELLDYLLFCRIDKVHNCLIFPISFFIIFDGLYFVYFECFRMVFFKLDIASVFNAFNLNLI